MDELEPNCGVSNVIAPFSKQDKENNFLKLLKWAVTAHTITLLFEKEIDLFTSEENTSLLAQR